MNQLCQKSGLLIYILLILLLCPACTQDMPTVQNIAAEQQKNDTKPFEIIISHSQNINTPEDIAARAMQRKLQELLGNQANVILYADYQMGSACEQIEAMQLGRVHISIQSASVVSAFVDDMKVFTLPYLFSSNTEEVKAVLGGVLEQEALERIGMDTNVSGFTGLGLWFGGYKLFTYHGDDNKHIQSPADFQGISIAVSDALLLKAQYQHWGAETIATDAIALYSTLAQHIADGSEGSASQIVSNHIQDVQHNVVQAYHSPEIYVILTNAEWYSSLPEKIQAAIMAAEQYGKEVLYDILPQKEAEYIERIRQTEGMRYEVLSEAEQAVFRASVQHLYTEQLSGSSWQLDYVERLQKSFT